MNQANQIAGRDSRSSPVQVFSEDYIRNVFQQFLYEAISLSLPIRWTTEEQSGYGIIAKLNREGCYIQPKTGSDPAKGQTILIRFSTPTGRSVLLDGEINDVQLHAGFRVIFRELTPEDESMLTLLEDYYRNGPINAPSQIGKSSLPVSKNRQTTKSKKQRSKVRISCSTCGSRVRFSKVSCPSCHKYILTPMTMLMVVSLVLVLTVAMLGLFLLLDKANEYRPSKQHGMPEVQRVPRPPTR